MSFFSLPSRPSLKGALEVNNILGKAEYLLKDLIKGPESIVVEGGKRILKSLIKLMISNLILKLVM